MCMMCTMDMMHRHRPEEEMEGMGMCSMCGGTGMTKGEVKPEEAKKTLTKYAEQLRLELSDIENQLKEMENRAA
ncbi:hypothetical protein [Candidatus Manganitrophus noduliformans]|uniref:Uncharacterized protein n=1 Tax=Candidatus Manganitrophus noduliformans TaxID=2606439 RepID=A0A7X6IDG5_9BACT|nr:hypothetical protein [Candidatus Manganitrophus noduliformans]NKE73419.1 hypothetical protein [Candidatus Manganitrophus noduliformans]